MPAPISREYRIYLALWRKALTGSCPPIKCPNLHTAVSMRQGLYRAIKPYKTGETIDAELTKAAEKYVPYLVKGEIANSIHFIEFRPRVNLNVLEAQLEELGLGDDDLMVGDERATKEKLHDLLNNQEEEERRSTPFYEM